jgi:hypothetical protein
MNQVRGSPAPPGLSRATLFTFIHISTSVPCFVLLLVASGTWSFTATANAIALKTPPSLIPAFSPTCLGVCPSQIQLVSLCRSGLRPALRCGHEAKHRWLSFVAIRICQPHMPSAAGRSDAAWPTTHSISHCVSRFTPTSHVRRFRRSWPTMRWGSGQQLFKHMAGFGVWQWFATQPNRLVLTLQWQQLP